MRMQNKASDVQAKVQAKAMRMQNKASDVQAKVQAKALDMAGIALPADLDSELGTENSRDGERPVLESPPTVGVFPSENELIRGKQIE